VAFWCAPKARTVGAPSHRHRQRREAPGAAQQRGSVAIHPHHRIIHRPQNGAVVGEEDIRKGPQAAQGFVILEGHGLFAEVARGADQGPVHQGKQQPVQGGVGQEGAEAWVPGRDAFRNLGPRPPSQQQDRRLGGGEPALFRLAHFAGDRKGSHVREHHREGPVFPVLPIPQTLNRLG
jgi:hypothetical protein